MEGVQQGLGLRPDSKGRVGQLAPSPSTRSGEHCKLLEWGPGWTLCCPTSMLYFKCISGQHLLLNSRGFFCTKMLYSAMCKRLCQVLEAVWNSNCDSTLHQVQRMHKQCAGKYITYTCWLYTMLCRWQCVAQPLHSGKTPQTKCTQIGSELLRIIIIIIIIIQHFYSTYRITAVQQSWSKQLKITQR